MTHGRILGTRFPYVPVRIEVQQRIADVDALLDTGFDGDVAVPDSFVAPGLVPDGHSRWTLADDSAVVAPYDLGTVELDGLGPFQAVVIVLGTESLVGAAARHVTIILDHGQQVIVQP